MRLLISGGDQDPNLTRLTNYALLKGVQVIPVTIGSSGFPYLNYDIGSNILTINDQQVQVEAAFLRKDVFYTLQGKSKAIGNSANEWFNIINGYLLINEGINIFNREFKNRTVVNKTQSLYLAQKIGLNIASSYVSNDYKFINKKSQEGEWIVKPLIGGDYAKEIRLDNTKNNNKPVKKPQFLQEKLSPPDIRVFRVGDEYISFKLTSDSLDYRTSNKTSIELIENDTDLCKKLKLLSDHLGLNFAAADFKLSSKDNSLCFLEINSNPMFAGFDMACDNKLLSIMLNFLVN